MLYARMCPKFSASLALFLLLLTGVFTPRNIDAQGSPTATLKVYPSSGAGTVGVDLPVDVQLDTSQSVGGVLVSISYSTNLEYVGAISSSSVFDQEIESPAPSGFAFQFARVRFDTGFNGTDGQVLKLTFRPTSNGLASI